MGKLIAGGDSFVYGSELQDCFHLADPTNGINAPYETVSNSTFTALISKEMQLEYVCTAWPGYSNSSIRRTIMNECYSKEDIDLVIVSWSFSSRYEFKFNDKWEQISPWSIEDNVEEIIDHSFQGENDIVFQGHIDRLAREKTLGITEFAKMFYKKIGSYEYWELYTSLIEIVFLQTFLEKNKIKYLFTCVDESLIKNISRHSADDSISTLFKQIDLDKWFWFPKEKGFYTWAKENKYPFATTHPREQAHIEAANLLYEHIRHLGWIS